MIDGYINIARKLSKEFDIVLAKLFSSFVVVGEKDLSSFDCFTGWEIGEIKKTAPYATMQNFIHLGGKGNNPSIQKGNSKIPSLCLLRLEISFLSI